MIIIIAVSLNRNTKEWTLWHQNRKKFCDGVAVSSVVNNSISRLDTSEQKVLGLQEIKEFFHDYQEELLTDEKIKKCIQVSNNCML